jgi:hypothetical protein
MKRMTGTLRADVCIFMIIPCGIHLTVTVASAKSCRENQNTHFMLNKMFSPQYRVVYGNVQKYCEGRQATDDSIMRRMRDA